MAANPDKDKKADTTKAPNSNLLEPIPNEQLYITDDDEPEPSDAPTPSPGGKSDETKTDDSKPKKDKTPTPNKDSKDTKKDKTPTPNDKDNKDNKDSKDKDKDKDSKEIPTIVYLKSGGDKPETFELSRKQLLLCNVYQYELTHAPVPTHYDIPQVNSDTLKDVVSYLRHHNGNLPPVIDCPVKSSDLNKYIKDKWDVEFMSRMSEKQLFRLLMASNYLDIASLLQLSCAAVASRIKGLSKSQQESILRDEERAYANMP